MGRKNKITNYDREPVTIMPGFVWAFFLWTLLLQSISFYFYKFERFTLNDGAFFGLFDGNAFAFVISILVLGVIYLLFWLKSGPDKLFLLLFCAVLSNLLDRIIYNGVVDYIFIGTWPAFNLADSLIVFIIIARVFLLLKKQ